MTVSVTLPLPPGGAFRVTDADGRRVVHYVTPRNAPPGTVPGARASVTRFRGFAGGSPDTPPGSLACSAAFRLLAAERP